MVDWYGVGLQLGIEETELDIIIKNSSDLKEQRRQMFRVWLRQTEQPSYLQLARALFIAEETNIGYHVCKKYGECPAGNCCRKSCLIVRMSNLWSIEGAN